MNKIPQDLNKALKGHREAMQKWEGLTPVARMDFVSWVEGAKQEETRKRRIERTCDMISKGKRRPCCYSVVPTNLYKSLSKNAKAKAVWQSLDAIEKRKFTSWIDEVKKADLREARIEKAFKMLASGKRRPN